MSRVAGIVLAAGASERMGGDKALLDWQGRTFLEHVAGALRAAGADPIRIVLGENLASATQALSLSPGETVHNASWREGMLSSIVAGLDALPPETEGAIVWPVDHPCVSSTLVRALMENFLDSGKLIALPVHGCRRGHPVLFSARLFDELRRAPREVGARHVVRAHREAILEVETDEDGILLNLNDRQAYDRILDRRPPG